MPHPRNIILLCLLMRSVSALSAQTFVGPGPDPACGGEELTITQQRGRASFIQKTVFASNRTIVEQYRPLPNNDWQITLFLYSSRWQKNEPLTKDRLIRSATFTASDNRKAAKQKELFGYGAIKWLDEPKRLLDYFHANRSEFYK
ncbi:MAG TPA: hypothetical protein VIT91_11615 [Chthoniobacterales bacterium]